MKWFFLKLEIHCLFFFHRKRIAKVSQLDGRLIQFFHYGTLINKVIYYRCMITNREFFVRANNPLNEIVENLRLNGMNVTRDVFKLISMENDMSYSCGFIAFIDKVPIGILFNPNDILKPFRVRDKLELEE